MPCFSCRTAEDDVCLKAAKNDHILCLQQARDLGFQWNCWTTRFAAAAGSLRCLQYAFEKGCDWDEDVCTLAAKFGHIECLSFAHENRCPWNAMAPIYAAKMGQLESLRYLFINNCPWDAQSIFKTAIIAGHLHCAEFVYERGPIWDKTTRAGQKVLRALCRRVIFEGQLDGLHFLYSKGCSPVYGFKFIDLKLCKRKRH